MNSENNKKNKKSTEKNQNAGQAALNSQTEKLDVKKRGKLNPITLAIVILAAAVIALIGWIIWDRNADAACKPGDYKNMTISLSEAEVASAGIAAGFEVETDDEEKVKQAILSRLVEDARFYHLSTAVSERETQYMNYYTQLVSLYDEYSSVEELATEYYGYESYDAFCTAVNEYAEASIKQELVLGKIAEIEGFTVTDEIFNTYIGKYLEAYNYSEDEIDDFLENYGKEDVYEVILGDYTLDMIESWCTIKE